MALHLLDKPVGSKLIDVEFIGLDDIAQDREALGVCISALGDLDAGGRKRLLKEILGAMLEGLAVSTEALDLTVLYTVGQKSRTCCGRPGPSIRRKRREAGLPCSCRRLERIVSGCGKSRPSSAPGTTPGSAGRSTARA